MPYGIPPLRGEAGGATFVGQHTPALHLAGGSAIASGRTSHDQAFDVGAGGFVDVTAAGANVRGIYVDTSLFIDHGEVSRTSVGVRGELRFANGEGGAGAKLRIDHELFRTITGSFSGDDRCGFTTGNYYGAAAIGFYSEAGRVWQPDGVAAWTATAGLSFRLPAVLGVSIGIPGC